MERAYTVSELDELRHACENKWLWGLYSGPQYNGCSRTYRAEEKIIAVEEMTRTHMLAGHTAADLIASEREPTIGE